MKRERRGLNPVWLVFVAPGLARGWLLLHTTTGSAGDQSWLVLAINASLLLALSVLTCLFASDLANAAGLWQRAKERFVVMATLSALAPPLSIAVAQAAHWGSFTLVEVISLWGLRATFRLLSRQPARVVSRERWFAWILSCLLSALGLWLLGSAFAVFWPLDSRSWLALSIPMWQRGDLALLLLAQLWVVAVCVCGGLLALGSVLLSFWRQHPLFLQLRKLVGASLLFCSAFVGVGALMGIMRVALLDGYMYMLLQACALTIPICNAAFFALPYMMTEHRAERFAQQDQEHQSSDQPVEKRGQHRGYGVILHAMFLTILSLYFCSQLSIYMTTDSLLSR